jgi:hypothetical protein
MAIHSELSLRALDTYDSKWEKYTCRHRKRGSEQGRGSIVVRGFCSGRRATLTLSTCGNLGSRDYWVFTDTAGSPTSVHHMFTIHSTIRLDISQNLEAGPSPELSQATLSSFFGAKGVSR